MSFGKSGYLKTPNGDLVNLNLVTFMQYDDSKGLAVLYFDHENEIHIKITPKQWETLNDWLSK